MQGLHLGASGLPVAPVISWAGNAAALLAGCPSSAAAGELPQAAAVADQLALPEVLQGVLESRSTRAHSCIPWRTFSSVSGLLPLIHAIFTVKEYEPTVATPNNLNAAHTAYQREAGHVLGCSRNTPPGVFLAGPTRQA